MLIVKLIKVLLIISVFLAAFFPVYVNVSAFAREEVSFDGIQGHSPEARNLLYKDIMDIALGNYDRDDTLKVAKKLKEKAESLYPNNTYYEALAFIYDYLGMHYRSIQYLKKQLKTCDQKNLGIVYGNLGIEYLKIEKLKEAKKAMDKSLKLAPKNSFVQKYLVQYYIMTKEYRKAALQLKKVDKLLYNYDYYYAIYLFMFDRITDKDEIVEFFREAVRADPESPFAHRMLATAVRNSSLVNIKENFPEIMKEFSKALKLDPGYVFTYISIADVYLILEAKTDNKTYYHYAMKWLNKAERLEPENLKVQYAMGNLYLAAKQYDKAIEKFMYVLRHGYDNPDSIIDLLAYAYNGKAYSFYESGKRLEEGLDIINKAIQIKPDDGVILSTKAEILYKMKRYKEAYKYIKKSIKMKSNHPEIIQDFKNIKQALKETGKLTWTALGEP